MSPGYSYIADLRATALFELDFKIFRLNQLGIPQDRIAKRLGVPQQTISRYLPKMPGLAKWVNSDLSKGFTVPQVAQKHGWPEPLVWSQALVNKDDFSRFKARSSLPRSCVGMPCSPQPPFPSSLAWERVNEVQRSCFTI